MNARNREHTVENGLSAEDVGRTVAWALNQRAEHGRHLHHSACIHNLPPEEQVELRGRTVEWWAQVIGPLPVQITPDEWECEPPPTRVIPPGQDDA